MARGTALRVRAARLGAVAVGLALVAVGLGAVAVLEAIYSGYPRPTAGFPTAVRTVLPPVAILVGGLASVLATVAAFAALEVAAAMRVLSARRRDIPDPMPLPLRLARAGILGPSAVHGPEAVELSPRADALRPLSGQREAVRCTVLIPAHDEEAVISRTLDSLQAQTRRPERVIVVADNCSDRTEEIGHEHGAEVVLTVANTEKKAGALNQVLARLLPEASARDVYLVIDADSSIAPEYLAVGLGLLEDDGDLMAVSGMFSGEPGHGLIGQCQRNEFARYQRLLARRGGRSVFVITGTGSLFRACAFQAVADGRGSLVPGRPGTVYDTLALTEDNELTLALKTLGAGMLSPVECRVETEVMPDLRALFRQRLRWHRGAVENVGAYGFTRATALYWAQQLALGYGVVALWSFLLLMVITALAAQTLALSVFWAVVGLIFLVERLVTAWAEGWAGRLVAAPVVIELAYAAYLQITFATGLAQIVLRREAGWNHVRREVSR